jgi:hypothetical protein
MRTQCAVFVVVVVAIAAAASATTTFRARVACTARHVVVELARSTSARSVSLGFRNSPIVGPQAHAAFSGVSTWSHRAVFVAVVAVAAASAATTARACVACTARHAEVALARHIGKAWAPPAQGLLVKRAKCGCCSAWADSLGPQLRRRL